MLRTVRIRKLSDLTFFFLMMAGVGLTLMALRVPPASACGGGGCIPSLNCIWGNCISEDVWFDQGNCTGCQCPPCQCVREIGHCSLPAPAPGPPYFAGCDCKVCANAGACGGGGNGVYSEACAELPESNGYTPGTTYPYCEYGYDPAGYANCCIAISPIVIDVLGNGYNLTGTNNPVSFDFTGSGSPVSISWTRANSDDAFLVLDRNGNRTIDNGAELFGNVTPQPLSSQKNGFLALAEYDKPSSGGNNDGKINRADEIYASLRLWQDTNHNGISEASELHRLPALNVVAIDLDYQESKRQDANGNLFRYRAKVRDAQGASVGRWAWDVFFVKQ